MLIYDDSFVSVMTATKNEAERLGARAFGSEHFLLGLLVAGGPPAEAVSAETDAVTYERVHDAVVHALDDAPLLENLGVARVAAQVADAPRAHRPHRPPRNRHTPELQTALNTATTKWGQLRKAGSLPRASKVDSAVLWLAVLEPTARASRLVRALGADPDRLRSAVLAASVAPGAPTPAWPTDVARTDPISRLVHRLMNRRARSDQA